MLERSPITAVVQKSQAFILFILNNSCMYRLTGLSVNLSYFVLTGVIDELGQGQSWT